MTTSSRCALRPPHPLHFVQHLPLEGKATKDSAHTVGADSISARGRFVNRPYGFYLTFGVTVGDGFPVPFLRSPLTIGGNLPLPLGEVARHSRDGEGPLSQLC